VASASEDGGAVTDSTGERALATALFCPEMSYVGRELGDEVEVVELPWCPVCAGSVWAALRKPKDMKGNSKRPSGCRWDSQGSDCIL
jgi:hypothetical protein